MRDHMDPVLGRALENEFAELMSDTPERSAVQEALRGREHRRHAMWATVAVALVVALAALFAIRAGQQTAPPAVTPTASAAQPSTGANSTALTSKLPKQPYGRTIHTWTDNDRSSTTGPFRFVGRTAVIAAVCEGGGTIAITDTSGSVHKEGCTRLAVQQPFWKFNLGGDNKPTKTTGPVRVTVKVLTGSPRYVVRLWAVDPRILDSNNVSVAATSNTVPKALRTCTSADLAPTGSLGLRSKSGGAIVTITSRSASDCAIRSWPTLQYLAASGTKLGPLWGADNNGKSVDSSEGKLDKYGQFPPARLTARGSAYLIVDVVTTAELLKEDAEQKARPEPTSSTGPSMPPIPLCDPQRVSTIRLGIGSATVTVPAPQTLDLASCTNSNRVFGVNPVVATRPDANP